MWHTCRYACVPLAATILATAVCRIMNAPLNPGLIGRQAELAEIEQILAAARDGRGAVALVAGFSQFHFHRVFGAMVGETVHEFVRRVRVVGARRPLVGA